MKKFIVSTWWTHVWKTSVLKYLEKEWYKINDSFAWKNMNILSKILWKDEYKIWRKDNFLDFQKMNIFRDLELYYNSLEIENTKGSIIFFDRGIFDWIASLKRENIDIPQNILSLVAKIQYFSKIFLFDSLPFHDIREDTWRMLDESISIKWAKFIENEYSERGYDVIKIPYIEASNIDESIKKRAKFLIDNI